MKNLIASINQWCSSIFCTMLTIFLLTGIQQSKAQNGDISIDLVLQPQLTKAQVLSLSNLGINTTGQGAVLFNLVIRNNENAPQNDLYLDIQLHSNKVGLIAELYQESGQPFSLDPMQVVVANNNQLQDGLPGIEESLRFDGGLTQQGEEFVNDLEGSTRLPADIYTVVLGIYQDNNSRNGGNLIANSEQVFGQNITSDTNIDLYLLQPGGEIGSDQSVNTILPVFRWDGPPNVQYRLLVVKDNGQSPEALLQAALSSAPVLENGSMAAGSLLEFEIVDALINKTTFSMPPSGVPDLKPGSGYFWQVYTNQETVDGTQSIPSEIWEFTVASNGGNVAATLSREVENALRTLIGSERLQQVQEDGFQFISIIIEGQTLQGAAALQKLEELSGQLANGDISVVIN